MTWFFLALGTAICEAVKDFLSKKILATQAALVVTLWLCIITALAMLPLLLWQGIPPLTPDYGWVLGVSASLNAVAFFLYNRALKITDLSLVVPIITLSPLFMFLTSPLILGEFGHWSDLGGSSLIVMGSYILNWDARGGGYLAPLGALWQKPGPRQMLGVTLIWSFTSNIDKIGIQSSSIAFWLFSLYGTIALILLGVALQQGSSVRLGKPQALGLTSIGLLNVCGILLQMQALHLTLVMRVISVKRLSTLMGVLLGVMFLQESGLRHRLLGAALMVMGVALLL